MCLFNDNCVGGDVYDCSEYSNAIMGETIHQITIFDESFGYCGMMLECTNANSYSKNVVSELLTNNIDYIFNETNYDYDDDYDEDDYKKNNKKYAIELGKKYIKFYPYFDGQSYNDLTLTVYQIIKLTDTQSGIEKTIIVTLNEHGGTSYDKEYNLSDELKNKCDSTLHNQCIESFYCISRCCLKNPIRVEVYINDIKIYTTRMQILNY